MTVRRILRFLALTIVAVVVAYFAFGMVSARGTFARTLPTSQAPGSLVKVGAKGHATVGRMLLDGEVDPSRPLIILLHGDAPFVNPGYQYGVAQEVAKADPGTRVVALMRPGYADVYGERSDGDRGYAVGDNYTPEDIDQVAQAVWLLKKQYGAKSVVLVGHSGGAAMTADVAALYPGLVQQAVLVACPCELASFREHMWQKQHWPLWLLPVKSVSPMDALQKMRPGVTVTAISGANDPIAPPQDVVAYVARATSLGINASVIVLPDKGHEIFDDSQVRQTIDQAH